MANRKRNIQLKFWVNDEERNLIYQKMKQLPVTNFGAYMRKMAIDGYIINTDLTFIKEYTKELQRIGRNINQIARQVNSVGGVYPSDIKYIEERLNEIWQIETHILSSLR